MKVALITGSTKGLGLHTAKLLAAKGCKIILTGRTKDTLEIAREQLPRSSEHVIFCGDLLEKKSIEALCNLPLFPDIIVHCLGGKIEGDAQPLNADIIPKSLALNLNIAVALNSHYLPLMQAAGRGRIIHVGSDSSETGRSGPAHAAAKAAINAYVKSTARFYVQHNLMICGILPGIFLSPGSAWDLKRVAQPDYYQKRLQEMPLGRFLLLEEIAEVIADIADSTSIAYAGSLIQLTAGH